MVMIKTEKVPYTHDKVDLEGFVAYPEKEKSGVVILCHAWAGRDPYICEKAEELAKLGFVGFALDMYGKGVLGKSKEENGKLKKPFIEDRQLLQNRVLKGFETACILPYVDKEKVAVLGFGFGALCALDLARTGAPLKGVVSTYGHFDPPKNCPQQPIKGKILILHGFNDPVSPVAELFHFQEELDKNKVDWQTYLFGNTYHAFANPLANDPKGGILYNPASADQSWRTAKDFLLRLLS